MPPRRISLDEAHHRRGHELATVVSDLDRRRVVEVIDGRSRRRIERYLRSLPDGERQAIEVVSIDPYEAYRLAIKTVLPKAVIVCDPFHLVRGANTALDTVRRERQRQAGSERGKGARRAGRTIWKRQLYQARHALLRGRERLSERERMRLCELYACEPLIAEPWRLKEAFRSISRATNRSQAEERLERFLLACRLAAIPSFEAFAKGVRLWRAELLAYFDQPVTNSYAEGVINKIKTNKRRAHGLPSFQGSRRRLLVACA